MGKQVDMERRRRVWNYVTAHPHLTSIEIAAALGLNERTVRRDIESAETTVNERAADAMRASIVERDLQLIEAHMPKALEGKTFNTQAIMSIHQELRALFGLDLPVEQKISASYEVQLVGVDPDGDL
jgi:hypothetical protein